MVYSDSMIGPGARMMYQVEIHEGGLSMLELHKAESYGKYKTRLFSLDKSSGI